MQEVNQQNTTQTPPPSYQQCTSPGQTYYRPPTQQLTDNYRIPMPPMNYDDMTVNQRLTGFDHPRKEDNCHLSKMKLVCSVLISLVLIVIASEVSKQPRPKPDPTLQSNNGRLSSALW